MSAPKSHTAMKIGIGFVIGAVVTAGVLIGGKMLYDSYVKQDDDLEEHTTSDVGISDEVDADAASDLQQGIETNPSDNPPPPLDQSEIADPTSSMNQPSTIVDENEFEQQQQ